MYLAIKKWLKFLEYLQAHNLIYSKPFKRLIWQLYICLVDYSRYKVYLRTSGCNCIVYVRNLKYIKSVIFVILSYILSFIKFLQQRRSLRDFQCYICIFQFVLMQCLHHILISFFTSLVVYKSSKLELVIVCLGLYRTFLCLYHHWCLHSLLTGN